MMFAGTISSIATLILIGGYGVRAWWWVLPIAIAISYAADIIADYWAADDDIDFDEEPDPPALNPTPKVIDLATVRDNRG
jgi:hypothetical protein